jgi:hypothetical protein
MDKTIIVVNVCLYLSLLSKVVAHILLVQSYIMRNREVPPFPS